MAFSERMAETKISISQDPGCLMRGGYAMFQHVAKTRKKQTKQKRKHERRQQLRLLREWVETVSDQMPHLSTPHVTL
jgi:hypothetical protein